MFLSNSKDRKFITMQFFYIYLQGLGLYVFYTFFQTLRAERTERAARLSAIQRQMSQGQVQPLPPAEIPLVRSSYGANPSSASPPVSSPSQPSSPVSKA